MTTPSVRPLDPSRFLETCRSLPNHVIVREGDSVRFCGTNRADAARVAAGIPDASLSVEFTPTRAEMDRARIAARAERLAEIRESASDLLSDVVPLSLRREASTTTLVALLARVSPLAHRDHAAALAALA